MTSDYSAVRIFLDILEPGLLPVPGTAIGDAIRASLAGFLEDYEFEVSSAGSAEEGAGTSPPTTSPSLSSRPRGCGSDRARR